VDDAGRTATVPLPDLEPGLYAVDYQVTSAVDGHITSGSLAFLVDPTGTQPAPAVSSQSDSLSSTPESTAARWVGLAAVLALAGTLLFWLVSARPALAAAGRAVGAPWPWIVVAGLLAVSGLVAYLLLAARPLADGGQAPAGGFPLDPAAPFGSTQFANAMRVALVGTGLATVVAVAGWRTRRAEGAWLVATLGAAILGLAGLSAAGHAAAGGGALPAAFDLLHLLGVAAWIGTLVGLLLLALRARDLIGSSLRRHSRVALAAAPVVALSGIASSPVVLGDAARDLVASEYGNLLLAKALLFAAAVGIGAANFFLVRRGALRLALPLVGVELAVGALAVVAAAGLVTGQPGAGRVPVVTTSGIGALHLFGTAGESTVHAAVNVPSPGEQRYQVSVTDTESGDYRTDVRRVDLIFQPPDGSGLAAERVRLEASAEPGLWGASGAHTPVVGKWRLEVIVRRQGEVQSASFSLDVAEPAAPQRLPPPDTGIGVPLVVVALWNAMPPGWIAWIPVLILLALGAAAYRVPSLPRSAAHRLRIGLILVAVVAGVTVGARDLVGAANATPPAAAAQRNAVEANDESVARGERLYQANCSSCHGTEGAGDGPAVAGTVLRLRRLADVVPTLTDGSLAHRIAVGTAGSGMPPFGAILSEEDRWDLVNYLRSVWGRED
jgi:putative copper export protein/mono/diheme cytochrome c family protein